MAHTRKIKVETMLSDRYDVEIYTSGGTLHTVVVIDYEPVDRGEFAKRWMKSFQGSDARKRAYEYSRSLIHEDEPCCA